MDEISPIQEMWLAGHIARRRKQEDERTFSYVRLLCSFIDPERAKNVFTEAERSESVGFLDDLKALNPDINMDDYKDVLDEE